MYFARMVPHRARTVARFTAADPWNGGRVTEWSIEGFQWAPRHWDGLPPAVLKKPPASYGLRSELDGEVRLLPDSLGHLVRTAAVPHGELPRLLAELSPEVTAIDMKPMLRLDVRRNLLLFAAFSLLCLLGWGVLQATATVPPPIGDRGPFYRMMLVTFGATGLLSTALFGPLALLRLRRRERQMEWALGRIGRSSQLIATPAGGTRVRGIPARG